MFKRFSEMTEEEKCKLSTMQGQILRGLEEAESLYTIADRLKLEPWQVCRNIDEMLYILKKHVGIKRYLQILFWK